MTVFVCHGRLKTHHPPGRVFDHAAFVARVIISRSGRKMDLKREDPSVSVDDLRRNVVVHTSVGHVHQIRRQKLFIFPRDPGKAGASALLLPVQKEFNMYRNILKQLQKGPDRHHMGHKLALVVRGAAAVKPPVLHRRLERLRMPQLQRLRRLHVVMTVKQDRRRVLPFGAQLGVNRWLRRRFQDLRLKAQAAEQARKKAAAFLNADILGADAGLRRDALPLLQIRFPHFINMRVKLPFHFLREFHRALPLFCFR